MSHQVLSKPHFSLPSLKQDLMVRHWTLKILELAKHQDSTIDVWDKSQPPYIVTEDIWRKDSHCAVYPEALLRIPILATCPIGGVVLDPFSGTGTTVRAAYKLGRKGIGIDLSPKYIETSKQQMEGLLL